jgi:excisionase family DNA binding protein
MNDLLSINELSKKMGVSRATIYRMIKKGLPVIKVGNSTRFDPVEVSNWLKENN